MKTKIVLLLVLVLLLALVRADETVPQTQTVLKSYFVNGAVPTETNYAELIDTMFYYIGQMSSNSAVILSNTTAIASNAIPAAANFSIHDTTLTLLSANNISVVSAVRGANINGVHYHYTISCSFSNSFPTTNYLVYFPTVPSPILVTNLPVAALAKTATNFTFATDYMSSETFNFGFIVK